MTTKKTRAPTSLKLNLASFKDLPEKPKSESSRSSLPLHLGVKDAPLHVDSKLMVTSLALAQDSHFLLNNNVTHVINCVSNHFLPQPQEGIAYLNLSMQDSLEQDLLEPISMSLDFISQALSSNPHCRILVHC